MSARPHEKHEVEDWPHKRIAKIRRSMLGIEDHGIWTASIDLDYGGRDQSAGGYQLDNVMRNPDGRCIGRVGTAFGMHFIMRLCEACGVEEWSKLIGRTVYALFNESGGSIVLGIAPLPMEPGKPFWFDECGEEVSILKEHAP